MAEQTPGLLMQLLTDGGGGRTAFEILNQQNDTHGWQWLWNSLPIEQRADAVSAHHVIKIVKFLGREYGRNFKALTDKAKRDKTADSVKRCQRTLANLEQWVSAIKAEVISEKFRSLLNDIAALQMQNATPTPDSLTAINGLLLSEWTLSLSEWTQKLLQALAERDLFLETRKPDLPIQFPDVLEFLDFNDGTQPTLSDSTPAPLPQATGAAADDSGKPDANKSNDAGEQDGKPEGMPTGELRNLMENVIFSMGENELTTAIKKKGCRFIAFAMKPKQKDNSQLRKVLRQLRLPPYELLSPPSGHGYFLNSKGVAVYEQLKKDRLEKSLKKMKSH